MSGETRYTDMVHYTFAQQLERELAESREQRDKWSNLWADLSRSCVKDIAKLERELAEAREQRDRLELWKATAQGLADRVVRQENELAEANHQVGKYADEARQAIDAHGAAVVELAAAKQIMGELCESCGWAMRFPGQPCRCELERELAAAKDALLKAHKDYGCELRDPNGTIWEHAAKVQQQRDRLETELADKRATIEDVGKLLVIGFEGPRLAAMRVIHERDEAREQRDRLAEALRELWNNHTLHGAAYELIEQTLEAVAGRRTPNNCQRPELCLLTETCIPCAICPHAVEGGTP
jgi:hypothetical protein